MCDVCVRKCACSAVHACACSRHVPSPHAQIIPSSLLGHRHETCNYFQTVQWVLLSISAVDLTLLYYHHDYTYSYAGPKFRRYSISTYRTTSSNEWERRRRFTCSRLNSDCRRNMPRNSSNTLTPTKTTPSVCGNSNISTTSSEKGT